MELTRTRTRGGHLNDVVYGCITIQNRIVRRILLGKRPSASHSLATLAIIPRTGAREANEEGGP